MSTSMLADPYRNLATAVLWQAYLDMQPSCYYRDEALRFFKSERCETYADYLGIYEGIENWIAKNFPRPRMERSDKKNDRDWSKCRKAEREQE